MSDDAAALRRVYNAVAHDSGSESTQLSNLGSDLFRHSAPQQAVSARRQPAPPAHVPPAQEANRRAAVTTDTEDDEDDAEVETLDVISRRVGKTIRDIRSLNPHLSEFENNDPLPPGTKIVFKRPTGNPTQSNQHTSGSLRGAEGPPPQRGAVGGGGAASSATGPTSGLTLRMLGSKFRRTRSELVDEIPEFQSYDLDDSLPRSLLANKSIKGISLTELLPREQRGSPARGQSATAISAGRHPSLSSTASGHQSGYHRPSEPHAQLRNDGAYQSDSTTTSGRHPLSPQRNLRPLSPVQSRVHAPHDTSASAAPRNNMTPPKAHGRPLSPLHSSRPSARPMSPVGHHQPDDRQGSDWHSARHRRREASRCDRMTMRCKIPHQIFVTPTLFPRDRYDNDEGSADDDKYTIRTIARHVARCSIDDLLDMNPELETLFGVDDFIPDGTAVCVPPNVILPKPRRPLVETFTESTTPHFQRAPPQQQTQHEGATATHAVRSYQPAQGQAFFASSLPAADDGFVDVEAPRVSRAPSLGTSARDVDVHRRSTPRRHDHEMYGPRPATPPVAHVSKASNRPQHSHGTSAKVLQKFMPSAAVGRTLSELAWSLGTTVDEIRAENTVANQYASHELLPEHLILHVPVLEHASTSSATSIIDATVPRTIEEERTAISKRAQEMRSLQFPSAESERPPYRRCTSPTHSRGASVTSQRSSITGCQRSSQLAAVDQHGLRTASASVEPDTNLRRFVVTNPHLSVDLIAKRIGVHPDVVYDLNTNELVDGPHGVYHFREVLPVGMLLRLPIGR